MILNLSKNFKPIPGQELEYESFIFSGGEPHIKIQDTGYQGRITITHRINSFNDLGLLCIAVDALRRMNFNTIELFLPYFPGARQDRVMVKGEPLTVKIYADLINQLQLSKVSIFDPHSDVTVALINNCIVFDNHKMIRMITSQLPANLLLASPDAGAIKKIYKLAAYLQDYEVLECGKKRDVRTGALSSFKVPSDDLKGAPCLIVDDICDGGGTFMGLAEVLKAKNSGDLFLVVSHGIFSKEFNELSKYFKKIYTTDSIKTIENNLVQQFSFNEIIN